MARFGFGASLTVATTICSSTAGVAQTVGGGYVPYSSYTSNKCDATNNTKLLCGVVCLDARAHREIFTSTVIHLRTAYIV
jgi:hypothetical protein